MIFPGSITIRLTTTASTNAYLAELLARQTLQEGSVVVTHTQTHGKGQENNTWESESGKNLTASMVLYPSFLKPELQFRLTMVISLAVCQVLDKLNLPVYSMIKWPNDILLGNRKVAGILIRNEISGNGISTSIAGLGLNINQASFSDSIPGAVSLNMLTGRQYDIEEILTDWHSCVAYWYDMLKSGRHQELEDAYKSRMYLLEQPSGFIIKGKHVRATIIGLAEYGMLLLEGDDGTRYQCAMKEVEFT